MGIFTGLIMEIGSVRRIERRSDGARLVISARAVLEGTRIGDSISINGADLTVIEMAPDFFSADASLETLKRTTLGDLSPGHPVNLERALAVGERLGGHMVQGHIDGTGTVLSLQPEGNAYRVRIKFPHELGRYIAMKGSIAVDGISLTVAAMGDSDWFEVAIIPHSWQNTIIRYYKPGDHVNLEVDVLAKYVERLLDHKSQPVSEASKLTVEFLTEQGF
jgi:riboflavin synthase